jgi:hypothetical protein
VASSTLSRDNTYVFPSPVTMKVRAVGRPSREANHTILRHDLGEGDGRRPMIWSGYGVVWNTVSDVGEFIRPAAGAARLSCVHFVSETRINGAGYDL